MFKKLSPLFFFFSTVLIAYGDVPISIDRVDFESLRDDWLQMRIELQCNGNKQGQDSRAKRYVENIKVKAYLVHTVDQSARKYNFYTSEVEIIIMEQGDDNNVYFYMPGLILERDQWQTEPDFYFVEITVGDTTLPPEKEGMSSSITSLDVLRSLQAKAATEAEKNANVLMPVYFVPPGLQGRVEKLPVFLRRDPLVQ